MINNIEYRNRQRSDRENDDIIRCTHVIHQFRINDNDINIMILILSFPPPLNPDTNPKPNPFPQLGTLSVHLHFYNTKVHFPLFHETNQTLSFILRTSAITEKIHCKTFYCHSYCQDCIHDPFTICRKEISRSYLFQCH